MSVFDAVRRSISLKVSLSLAALLAVLLGAAATIITLRQIGEMEEQLRGKAQETARLAARQYGEKLEDAIDTGFLTSADVFDRHYVEIKGYDWGTHPKFHTRYDSLTDRTVLPLLDSILEDPDFLYSVGVDENGYVPTHNGKNQLPLEGNEKDLVGNRTKRIYNNPVELKAAQSLEPFLLQVYARDTGETMWDVAVPIMVKGKHWGAFRLGVSLVRLEARKASLVLSFGSLLGVFGLLTIVAIFFLVRRLMKPVLALTDVSVQISLGEALDKSIESDNPDEIGQLANAIERLRVAMKAAMSRLGVS
jgi:HAMP domain-containing protein